MRRISIEWETSHADGVYGTVSVEEHTTPDVVPIKKRAQVHYHSQGSWIKPVEGERHLPEFTREEENLIDLMGKTYLQGVTKSKSIYHWMV